MMNGYFRRPDLSTSAFHEAWYLTGDLGYLAIGELYIRAQERPDHHRREEYLPPGPGKPGI